MVKGGGGEDRGRGDGGRGRGEGGGTGLRCAGWLPVSPRSAGVDEVPLLAEPWRGGGSRRCGACGAAV